MPKFYPKPEFSRNEVNKAGVAFVNPKSEDIVRLAALDIINNWRVAHNFPLNTFQMRLREKAKKINPESLVAQRIKRLASIQHKLERFPDMKMAQIQDIGGCRAIMKDIVEVDTLVNIYKHESSGIKHKLAREQDYIMNPKKSGYRGVHLIYKYKSDKSKDYEDMRIEIQIRTLVQHSWATAVEIIGTFINQSLKSSQGEADWLRFFALMSSMMAILERKPSVPDTPATVAELREEIKTLAAKLNVERQLMTFRNSIQVLGGEKAASNTHYFLMELDPAAGRMTVRPYTQSQLTVASADYHALEKRAAAENKNVVLVTAESIDALKLTYPNYYLDADFFLEQLRMVLRDPPPPVNQLSLF